MRDFVLKARKMENGLLSHWGSKNVNGVRIHGEDGCSNYFRSYDDATLYTFEYTTYNL
jgi:hypothetical protein